MLGYLHTHLKKWEMGDFWPSLNEAIRGGDEVLLVLLDGLDEVPVDLRSRVVETVQDFADRYQWHRYVVTCRPYAYVGQPGQLRRFKAVMLASFNEEQIDHFIAIWYRELVHRGRLSSRKAETKADQMQRAVRRRDLQGLAQRPLLLTVMTLLHTFRGQLPQDRTEVYADAVDLLLCQWKKRIGEKKGIPEGLNVPGLEMSDLKAGLHDVALRAHSAGGGEDSVADVDEGNLRMRMEDYPGEAAKLIRRSSSRWREVFVLAAGHAARERRPIQAISAVNALCLRGVNRVDQTDAATYRLTQLAGEALLEIGLIDVRDEEVGQAVLTRVQEWLMNAMRADAVLESKERAEASNTLARLGDPRPRVRSRDDGLPDIVWCEVAPGPLTMGSDVVRDESSDY